MNISWNPPQNKHCADRWSPKTVPETKTQVCRENSAPPIANHHRHPHKSVSTFKIFSPADYNGNQTLPHRVPKH